MLNSLKRKNSGAQPLFFCCAQVYNRCELCYNWRRNGGEIVKLKDRVLEALEQNRSLSVSGEQLAQELGVTRAAVWKAIRALRDEGYGIEAGTNRGYSLPAADGKLSAQ